MQQCEVEDRGQMPGLQCTPSRLLKLQEEVRKTAVSRSIRSRTLSTSVTHCRWLPLSLHAVQGCMR